MSPWFVSFISHAQTVPSDSLFPRLSIFVCFHRASYVFVKENVAFRLHNLLKEFKVFVHNFWKSVCVRVEFSIAEEYEDTLGWEANRSVGYCLPCLELLQPMTLKVIEPGALENESFACRDNCQACIQVKQESLSQYFSQYRPGSNTFLKCFLKL